MDDSGVRFARGFSLHEALAMVEEDDFPHAQADIVLLPPDDTAETDEDSGEEDNMSPDNLPPSQLRTQAEIHLPRSEDYDSEDDMPLARLVKPKSCTGLVPKIQRQYHWVEGQIVVEAEISDDWSTENEDREDTPIDWFLKLFDEEIFDLLVIESNRYAAMKNKNNKTITVQEMKAFVGILILSGYVPYPRRKMYWERDRDVHSSLLLDAKSAM